MSNKANALRIQVDAEKATYGIMQVEVPMCGTRYVGWARVDSGQNVFTGLREEYRAARMELDEECEARGWRAFYFDGQTVHPADRDLSPVEGW